MLDKIEALRKEPKHIRNRYAFLIALCISCLVALIWALTLSARFAEPASVEVKQEEGAPDWTEVFGRVKESIVTPFKNIRQKPDTQDLEGNAIVPSNATLDLDALIASSTPSQSATTSSSTAIQATSSAQQNTPSQGN